MIGAGVVDFDNLAWTPYFLRRCRERAPHLVNKGPLGDVINRAAMKAALASAKEVSRPKTIALLIKYGETSQYFKVESDVPEERVMLVVDGNKLITVYPARGSWKDGILSMGFSKTLSLTKYDVRGKRKRRRK